mmetsp:Transcript_58916/g.104725  ORF Transcript_58916/g.104725 Transcript_58916/m.104725 type:complete len:81 (-) Transcript_58916:33-275(-)
MGDLGVFGVRGVLGDIAPIGVRGRSMKNDAAGPSFGDPLGVRPPPMTLGAAAPPSTRRGRDIALHHRLQQLQGTGLWRTL